MSFLRALARGAVLVLFGLAAVVVMTTLFRAQMRFDRQAELQIKLASPRLAPALTAAAGMTAQAGEETSLLRAGETGPTTDARLSGESGSQDTTASVRTPLTPAQVAGLMGLTSLPESSTETRPAAVPAAAKNAVTIRVRKSGSALDAPTPDRWVDVVLTRQTADGLAVDGVVVQNARVLAVDRPAAEGGEHASTNDAVTLEVDAAGAQKLLSASKIGALSLIPRASGDHSLHETRQISISDPIKAASAPEQDNDRFTSVTINRGGAGPSVHRVPKER